MPLNGGVEELVRNYSQPGRRLSLGFYYGRPNCPREEHVFSDGTSNFVSVANCSLMPSLEPALATLVDELFTMGVLDSYNKNRFELPAEVVSVYMTADEWYEYIKANGG